MTQHESIASALAAVPPDERDTWVKMAFAVKHALGDQGFDLWDAWSQTAGDSYNARAALATWKSAKAEGGVTAGTLYAVAKEHGWTGTAQRSPAQTRDQREARKSAEAVERARLAAGAAAAAERAERFLTEATMDTHGYLDAKGFPEAQGLVLDDKLLIPMRDERTGELISLQFIDADGGKRFLAHGRASGAVLRLGRSAQRWYCEGYATALSVQAALRLLYRRDEIVVCFSASNLEKVTRRGGIVIADHDFWICSKCKPRHRWDAPWGETACPVCGSDRITPPAGERHARHTGQRFWMPDEPGDANDFAAKHGNEALASALRELLQH